jgi:PAT family beta-lactamase induction signal transducer AmpG
VTAQLGQRRSWMLLAQVGVISGLLLMARSDPTVELGLLVWSALLVAFSSATQDISIDAWRIEAVDLSRQGAMAATYQLGYRVGMILAGAGALYLAEYFSWQAAYATMGLCMLAGVVTVLIIPEPDKIVSDTTWQQERRVVAFVARSGHLPGWLRTASAWFIGAIVCPFTEFFVRNGRMALLILLFIAVYRISDITMGIMAMPFYIDMGYTKTDIANISKIYGLFMTIFGAAAGGVMVARYGVLRILLVGAIIVVLTNLLFALLALRGPSLLWLTMVISADNFAQGLAGSAFIAYLSGLTNKAYTATQYALFSSLMLLPSKFIGGFSGDVVDAAGYIPFFIYAASLGVPAIALVLYLMHRERKVSTT